MTVITMVLVVFILMETSNIFMLYFVPGTRLGNGVGVFNAWEKSKADPEVHQFVRYLVYWVAGTKLIFIVLLVVILLTAGAATKLWAVGVLIVSIFSFFWKLFPIIKKLDADGEITPGGYSRTLGWMISGMIIMFAVALVLGVFAQLR